MDQQISANARCGETLDRAAVAALAASGAPVHLIDCDLEGADLSDLDLTGWQFERCNLRRTDLAGAQLEGSRWRSVRAPFANFARANLADAALASSDLNNAVLRGTRLSGAVFAGCKLTGADLSDAGGLDARFEETLLVGAKLAGHSFRKQTLQRVDFGQADLRKADFREAVLDGCSLRDANVAGARFDKADLRRADLGGLRLIDANLFRGATISREQAGQLLSELGLKVALAAKPARASVSTPSPPAMMARSRSQPSGKVMWRARTASASGLPSSSTPSVISDGTGQFHPAIHGSSAAHPARLAATANSHGSQRSSRRSRSCIHHSPPRNERISAA